MSDLDEQRLRPARSRPTALTPGQVHRARLACAAGARAAYPQDGDPRAVGDLAGPLAMLGLDESV